MGVFGHVVRDVGAAAKNNPGEIHRVVLVRRGKSGSAANVEVWAKTVKENKNIPIRCQTEKYSTAESLYTKKLLPRRLTLLKPVQQLELGALQWILIQLMSALQCFLCSYRVLRRWRLAKYFRTHNMKMDCRMNYNAKVVSMDVSPPHL